MTYLSRRNPVARPQPAAAATAVALLATVFYSFALSVAVMWAQCRLSWWIFPAAVVAAIVTALVAVPRAVGEGAALKVTVLTLAVVAAAVGAAWVTIDYSYDGLYYHQEIIAALCDGWDPFAPPFDKVPRYTPWAVHYAKAVEIAAAAIVSCTGVLETGKAINIIALAAMACGVNAWLGEQGGRLTRHRTMLTLAAVANPVVWSQLFTYYIDFYKYVYLIFALMAFGDIALNRRRGYVVLFMTLLLAMATKFNIFFEAGLWVLAAMIWWGIRGERGALKGVFVTGLLALFIGVALTFHPYVTNWLQAGHPLYPLMGEGAEDIMTSNTPAGYLGRSRFVTFFLSLASVTLPNVGQPVGGFTPLMPVILLLSLWILFRLRGAISGAALYTVVLVTLSCFLFEQAWWARYICQLWAVPVILVAAAYRAGRAMKAARLTAWLMIVAGAFAFVYAGKQMAVVGGYQKIMLEAAAEEPEVLVTGEWWGPQFARQMDEAGVNYRYSHQMPDTTARTVLYYHEYNDPLVIMSPEGAAKIRARIEGLHLNYDRHVYGSAEAVEYLSTQ
ncbi:MAG: hypothetical protein K2K68_10985 [Duncaniella sp.]|nr:hypothetical protein [Duncaniella sp.]